jgi:acetyl-CoA acetyltransferase
MSATHHLPRGGIAIVGAAESDLGEVAPGMTPVDLMAQATCRALADCGLSLADVDGVFASGVQTRMASVALTEYLRLKPRYQDSSFNGGSVFETMVGHAAAAIQLGLCSVAVIAYGSTQRSVAGGLVGIRGYDPLITPFGPRMPLGAYALAASRHMFEFGTTRADLAEVAVAARQWALLNPVAWEKKPLTVQEVLSSRIVSHPFTLRDCCLVTDGGGAVVLVSAERARSLCKPPAYVLGIGDAVGQLEIHSMDDLTTTSAVQSGQRAFEMARLTPKDVDVVELYDAFTINTILFLEDLGFVPKGEGLSYGHPGMYGLQLLIEAVRQVRGECGARQVRDCHVAVAHGNGGTLSSQSTVILGSEQALA